MKHSLFVVIVVLTVYTGNLSECTINHYHDLVCVPFTLNLYFLHNSSDIK